MSDHNDKPYQVMPDMTEEEYESLKADISEHGVLVPVEIDEDGNILDGHHRVRACMELGITDYPTITREGMTETEKLLHAYTLNTARRHLTREQKAEAVKNLLRRDPTLSDRQIARAVGVTHPTVSKYRKKMESSGQVVKVTSSTGSDGKEYPRKMAYASPNAERPTSDEQPKFVLVEPETSDQEPRKFRAQPREAVPEGVERYIRKLENEVVQSTEDYEKLRNRYEATRGEAEYLEKERIRLIEELESVKHDESTEDAKAGMHPGYSEADIALLNNVAVYNTDSLIAELKSSVEKMRDAIAQSIVINESMGVVLTDAQKDRINQTMASVIDAIDAIRA